MYQTTTSGHHYGRWNDVLAGLLEGKQIYKMNIKYGENPQQTASTLITAITSGG
jgi:hypothetical protein